MSKKKSLVQKIFSKLKRAFYYEVDVILAAKHPHNEYHFFPGIAYRNFTKDDISIFSSGFSDLTTLYNESADQYTGLVCELYGKPACCIWYTDKTKENEGAHPFTFTVTPPPRGVYIFANYVLPEFRGSKIFASQPTMVLSMMYDIGFRIAVVALFDPRIMNYYHKKGFFAVGKLHFKRYLSFFIKKDLSDLERICTL